MAEVNATTNNDNNETTEQAIEMSTLTSNGKAEQSESRQPEVIKYGQNLFKIVCVGDYSGGWSKTVYIEDYNCSDDTIPENPQNKAVLGVDFSMKILTHKSGQQIRLQLWIVGEQERFGNMTKVFSKGAHGILIFWGAKERSLKSALRWKNDFSKWLERDIPIVLIVDNVFSSPAKWIGPGLVVSSSEEMDQFCEENGFFAWFEMRKREGGEKGVFGQAMNRLVDEIISRYRNINT